MYHAISHGARQIDLVLPARLGTGKPFDYKSCLISWVVGSLPACLYLSNEPGGKYTMNQNFYNYTILFRLTTGK